MQKFDFHALFCVQDHFFGCGGILGLPSSLTGVLLPEAGPATAVGNALQTGPITFHVPQTLINDLRAEAAKGNQEQQQLELDLFRYKGSDLKSLCLAWSCDTWRLRSFSQTNHFLTRINLAALCCLSMAGATGR